MTRKPSKTETGEGSPSTGNEKGRSAGKTSRKAPKQYEHFIFRDWCKACRICAAFCPRGVIGWSDTKGPVIEHPEKCIGCRFCELHCPDFAITIQEKPDEGSKEAP